MNSSIEMKIKLKTKSLLLNEKGYYFVSVIASVVSPDINFSEQHFGASASSGTQNWLNKVLVNKAFIPKGNARRLLSTEKRVLKTLNGESCVFFGDSFNCPLVEQR